MRDTKPLDERSFACGVAATLAELVRLHDKPDIAADILKCMGMAEDVAHYADPYDYYALKLAEPSLRRPKRQDAKLRADWRAAPTDKQEQDK